MSLTVKFVHAGECRRLRVASRDGGSIAFVHNTANSLFGIQDCVLSYIDNEQDKITVRADGDLEEAIRQSPLRCLRLDVQQCTEDEISDLASALIVSSKEKDVVIKDLQAKLEACQNKDAQLEAAELQIVVLQAENELLTQNIYDLGERERRLSLGNDDLEEELQSLRQYSADVADKNDGLESSLLTTVESVQSVKEALDRITAAATTKRALSYDADAALAKKMEQERQDGELAHALQLMANESFFVTDSNGGLRGPLRPPSQPPTNPIAAAVQECKRRGKALTVAAASHTSYVGKRTISEAEAPTVAAASNPLCVNKRVQPEAEAGTEAQVCANAVACTDDAKLQALDFGQSLRVFYQGVWYDGRFIKINKADRKYVIQCDVDEEGEYTFASPEFIRHGKATRGKCEDEAA